MTLTSTTIQLPTSQPPYQTNAGPPLAGLLVSSDACLARAFRRELKRIGRFVALETSASLEEAAARANSRYAWITIDLDGAIAPSDAVRIARRSWPGMLVAVVSYWWSEEERLAHAEADHVIHKPVRASELETLFARFNGATSGSASNATVKLQERPSPR